MFTRQSIASGEYRNHCYVTSYGWETKDGTEKVRSVELGKPRSVKPRVGINEGKKGLWSDMLHTKLDESAKNIADNLEAATISLENLKVRIVLSKII